MISPRAEPRTFRKGRVNQSQKPKHAAGPAGSLTAMHDNTDAPRLLQNPPA